MNEALTALPAWLKEKKLVLNWRKHQTTRAMAFTTIKYFLNQLPMAYIKGLYE